MRCRTWFPWGDSTTCQADGGMAALGPLKLHPLCFNLKYMFQKFKCVGYVSNCCGLPYMSAQLICHELQPQFAAHTKLEQKDGSSKITQVDVNDIN